MATDAPSEHDPKARIWFGFLSRSPGALLRFMWGGFPYIQKKSGYPYSNLSAGGPSFGFDQTRGHVALVTIAEPPSGVRPVSSQSRLSFRVFGEGGDCQKRGVPFFNQEQDVCVALAGETAGGGPYDIWRFLNSSVLEWVKTVLCVFGNSFTSKAHSTRLHHRSHWRASVTYKILESSLALGFFGLSTACDFQPNTTRLSPPSKEDPEAW